MMTTDLDESWRLITMTSMVARSSFTVFLMFISVPGFVKSGTVGHLHPRKERWECCWKYGKTICKIYINEINYMIYRVLMSIVYWIVIYRNVVVVRTWGPRTFKASTAVKFDGSGTSQKPGTSEGPKPGGQGSNTVALFLLPVPPRRADILLSFAHGKGIPASI